MRIRFAEFFDRLNLRKQRFDPNAQLPSFENITCDAEVLLAYAATAGTTLSQEDVRILTAAETGTRIDVISAYSRVAAQLPVTAFALRNFFSNYWQNFFSTLRGGSFLPS